MGKNRRGNKEFTREQKLSKENKQLKRELQALRKEISRMDLAGLETARQIFSESEEKERFEENVGNPTSNIDQQRKEWACDSCSEGWLEIVRYPKLGSFWYYRACVCCKKRTTGKLYTENVKGIMKNTQ